MFRRSAPFIFTLLVLGILGIPRATLAKNPTVAILGFQSEVESKRVAKNSHLNYEFLEAIFYGHLSKAENLDLVERQTLDKALTEQSLNLSGLVSGPEAVSVGKLVGAQVLLSGRAFIAGDQLFLTARIVATETGRVFSVNVAVRKFSDKTLVDQGLMDLAKETEKTILKHRKAIFVAHKTPKKSFKNNMDDISWQISGKNLPRIYLKVDETSIGGNPKNPISVSELSRAFLALNIPIKTGKISDMDLPYSEIHADYGSRILKFIKTIKSADLPDVLVFGEAISQVGVRQGDLISAKAKVKLAAFDAQTGKVIRISQSEKIGLDVLAGEASRNAIQKATLACALDFIPQMVLHWNRKQK